MFYKGHGRKDDNGNKAGMYIPTPHDHVKWLAKRLSKCNAWKEKEKEDKAEGKRKETKATPTSGSAPSKLSLLKSFKSSLTTHIDLSGAEVERIITRMMTQSKEESEDAFAKILGPEHTGSKFMDRLNFCLIAFVFFLQMTLTILSVAMFLVKNPSTIGIALVNGAKWTAIFCLYPIIFALSELHSLIQI